MNWCKARGFVFVALVSLTVACGGGGGSSGSAGGATGTGGGNTGGGSGSGGGGSGTAATPQGLLPGGVGVAVDNLVTGVELDVAVGGTGMSIGDIQDFGSVIMNDIEFNTDNADFFVEGNAAAETDLRQGQQVLIVANDEDAQAVFYRSNVQGPITSLQVDDALLGRAQLVVFGQTVFTDAATTFADTRLLDLQVDDLIEVSGVLADDGSLTATYIASVPGLSTYKVTGEAQAVTSTAFSIGALNVDYSAATLDNFNSGVLSSGDFVEVRGSSGGFSAPGDFSAEVVERLPTLSVGTGALTRIEGVIDRFDSSTDFDVQSTPVTTDGATVFVNGDEDDLGLGMKVQVEGTTDAEGVTLASRVSIQASESIRAEGDVEAIDLAQETVTLFGIEFQLRENTRFEDDSNQGLEPLTLADLGIGDELEIRGFRDGADAILTQVEREDAEVDAELRGPITGIDAAAQTLEILGTTIQMNAMTSFSDEQDNTLTASEFFSRIEVNTFVSADWDVFAGLSVAADSLSLEDD